MVEILVFACASEGMVFFRFLVAYRNGIVNRPCSEGHSISKQMDRNINLEFMQRA